jgi:hypothetical protein
MTMSDESQQTDLFQAELELMSSREDSPVRTSPLQEIKKELMRNAVDCGQSAPVYLGTFDPDMPSLKTSQTCLLETGEIGLSEFYGTFPRSGTMRNGTVYQLPRLAPTITEIGSGLWPTPTGMTGGEGIAPSHKDGTHGWSLGAAAKDSLTQKPIRIWPTPTANEDAAGTPNGKMQVMLGNHPSLRGTTSEEWGRGTLNPTWVEWLMGFPLGHTDLDA